MAGNQETEGPREFCTTHWSVVMEAARGGGEERQKALATLCESYWHPLYFFARRKVRDPHLAKDLIQGFFCRLLEKNFIQSVDPEKGRFRAFMITALKHHMANEWDKAHAQKRGGLASHVSLDFSNADQLFSEAPVPKGEVSPELQFDRDWALIVVNRLLTELRADYESRGKGKLFDELREALLGESTTVSYDEIASRHDVAVGTIKSEVHRLRKRFVALLRSAVAKTVEKEADIDDELRYLISHLL